MVPAMSVPISRRPGDWVFVGCFAFFAFSSFFSDVWHALDLLHGDSFWARANRGYVEMAGDEFLLEDHDYLRINTGISGFVYGPFYLVLVYAFFVGKNWIRTPGLIYVGAMLHGYAEFLYYEFVLGPSPTNLPVFWAFNAPYGIVPLLLGFRLWRAPVFEPRARSPASAEGVVRR